MLKSFYNGAQLPDPKDLSGYHILVEMKRGCSANGYIKSYCYSGYFWKSRWVSRLVEECLAAGIKPTDIINNGLVSGMETIAERFKNNDIYLEVF